MEGKRTYRLWAGLANRVGITSFSRTLLGDILEVSLVIGIAHLLLDITKHGEFILVLRTLLDSNLAAIVHGEAHVMSESRGDKASVLGVFNSLSLTGLPNQCSKLVSVG